MEQGGVLGIIRTIERQLGSRPVIGIGSGHRGKEYYYVAEDPLTLEGRSVEYAARSEAKGKMTTRGQTSLGKEASRAY